MDENLLINTEMQFVVQIRSLRTEVRDGETEREREVTGARLFSLALERDRPEVSRREVLRSNQKRLTVRPAERKEERKKRRDGEKR